MQRVCNDNKDQYGFSNDVASLTNFTNYTHQYNPYYFGTSSNNSSYNSSSMYSLHSPISQQQYFDTTPNYFDVNNYSPFYNQVFHPTTMCHNDSAYQSQLESPNSTSLAIDQSHTVFYNDNFYSTPLTTKKRKYIVQTETANVDKRKKRPKIVKFQMTPSTNSNEISNGTSLMPIKNKYNCNKCESSYECGYKLLMHQHRSHNNGTSTTCPICCICFLFLIIYFFY